MLLRQICLLQRGKKLMAKLFLSAALQGYTEKSVNGDGVADEAGDVLEGKAVGIERDEGDEELAGRLEELEGWHERLLKQTASNHVAYLFLNTFYSI
jgi:hypothetical protein